LIDKREKLYQAIGEFIGAFVTDLNHLSEDGWSLLVEGQRDVKALRKLGFFGHLVTISSVGRKGTSVLGRPKKVVILTDLDSEGSILASRYAKRLSHDGFKTSLRERLRLKVASRGVFLHVGNLSRFAEEDP
jgi:5S rRNA maturation endonuclease (ribonuclease M5)